MAVGWLSGILQVIVAAGLLNVWLVRAGRATNYRGGQARTLRGEFEAYGLPSWLFYGVGALKLGVAVAMLVGLWIPALVGPAAAVLLVLMIGAVAMHVRVRDPLTRSLPALAMLLMSTTLLVLP